MLQANLERLKTTLLLMLSVLTFAKANVNAPNPDDSRVAVEKIQIENLIKAQEDATIRYAELVASFSRLETQVTSPKPDLNHQGNVFSPIMNLNSMDCLKAESALGTPHNGYHDASQPYDAVHSQLSICAIAVSHLASVLNVSTHGWRSRQDLDPGIIGRAYADLGTHLGRLYTHHQGRQGHAMGLQINGRVNARVSVPATHPGFNPPHPSDVDSNAGASPPMAPASHAGDGPKLHPSSARDLLMPSMYQDHGRLGVIMGLQQQASQGVPQSTPQGTQEAPLDHEAQQSADPERVLCASLDVFPPDMTPESCRVLGMLEPAKLFRILIVPRQTLAERAKAQLNMPQQTRDILGAIASLTQEQEHCIRAAVTSHISRNATSVSPNGPPVGVAPTAASNLSAAGSQQQANLAQYPQQSPAMAMLNRPLAPPRSNEAGPAHHPQQSPAMALLNQPLPPQRPLGTENVSQGQTHAIVAAAVSEKSRGSSPIGPDFLPAIVASPARQVLAKTPQDILLRALKERLRPDRFAATSAPAAYVSPQLQDAVATLTPVQAALMAARLEQRAAALSTRQSAPMNPQSSGRFQDISGVMFSRNMLTTSGRQPAPPQSPSEVSLGPISEYSRVSSSGDSAFNSPPLDTGRPTNGGGAPYAPQESGYSSPYSRTLAGALRLSADSTQDRKSTPRPLKRARAGSDNDPRPYPPDEGGREKKRRTEQGQGDHDAADFDQTPAFDCVERREQQTRTGADELLRKWTTISMV
ncbi:hypothetical protein LTR53_004195 [Teratosphaeriaceae sp. CCFEE 6253]|nr:hypothetical protein LTR53_004195 [Teratosphaeriaceae sp. CCFEE 6253]